MGNTVKKENKFVDKAVVIARKLSEEVHLKSIRDAFLFTIPFLVLSGFMVFFAYVLFADGSALAGLLPKNVVSAIQTICSKAINGGQNILALLMVLLTSFNLAKYRGSSNPIMPAIVSLGSLFILMPSKISWTPLGTYGMFVSLITALLVTEAFLALQKQDKLKIKIKGDVPPAIIESFNDMLSIIILELSVAILSFFSVAGTGMEVHDLINTVIQKPMVGVATNLPAFLLYFGFGQCLCYFFGIHPAGVINPIFEPALTVAINENNAAWLAGQTIPHIISLPFRDVYGTLGGIGSTLGLIIAIFLVSKREDLRSIAKVGLPTSVFNINEPMLFGLPIVFNPLLFIPFCFTTTVIYIVAYFATAAGMVSKLVVFTTWSTPIFLSGYMASGGDWRNVVLQVICLGIATLIYLPFVLILNKQKVESVEDTFSEDDLSFGKDEI